MKLYSEDLIKKALKVLDNDTFKSILKSAILGATVYASKEIINPTSENKQEKHGRPITKEEFVSKINEFSKVAEETSSNYYKLEEAKKIVNYVRRLQNVPGEWYEVATKAIGDVADQTDSWFYKGQITDLMTKF